MTAWNDFNDADQQQSFELIPEGTVAKVRMTIKPGGYDDPSQGWSGGFATQSFETGSVYLACEFVVLEGRFARRKLWSNIGLHSPKGPAWGNMGRTFVRAALNSARNLRPQDNSPQAAAARRIAGLHELNGLEFVARIDLDKDGRGQSRNVIKLAIEPDHPQYSLAHASVSLHAPVQASAQASAQPAGQPPGYSAAASNVGAAATSVSHPGPHTPPRPPSAGKPAWAQ